MSFLRPSPLLSVFLDPLPDAFLRGFFFDLSRFDPDVDDCSTAWRSSRSARPRFRFHDGWRLDGKSLFLKDSLYGTVNYDLSILFQMTKL